MDICKQVYFKENINKIQVFFLCGLLFMTGVLS